MNNLNDVVEVYESLLKYFSNKGYDVKSPDGKIKCVEITDPPNNNVEISLNFETIDAYEIDSGKYGVYGKCTFTLAKTEETDPQFADQIMQDMKYFMEHFIRPTLH